MSEKKITTVTPTSNTKSNLLPYYKIEDLLGTPATKNDAQIDSMLSTYERVTDDFLTSIGVKSTSKKSSSKQLFSSTPKNKKIVKRLWSSTKKNNNNKNPANENTLNTKNSIMKPIKKNIAETKDVAAFINTKNVNPSTSNGLKSSLPLKEKQIRQSIYHRKSVLPVRKTSLNNKCNILENTEVKNKNTSYVEKLNELTLRMDNMEREILKRFDHLENLLINATCSKCKTSLFENQKQNTADVETIETKKNESSSSDQKKLTKCDGSVNKSDMNATNDLIMFELLEKQLLDESSLQLNSNLGIGWLVQDNNNKNNSNKVITHQLMNSDDRDDRDVIETKMYYEMKKELKFLCTPKNCKTISTFGKVNSEQKHISKKVQEQIKNLHKP